MLQAVTVKGILAKLQFAALEPYTNLCNLHHIYLTFLDLNYAKLNWKIFFLA